MTRNSAETVKSARSNAASLLAEESHVSSSSDASTFASPMANDDHQNEPSVFRGDQPEVDESLPSSDMQLGASNAARSARDLFREAMNATNRIDADSSYLSCISTLKDAWRFASVRSASFRDLLGLLEAAISSRELGTFEHDQREALSEAFDLLVKPFIDVADVDRSIDKFAISGIDIMGPLKSSKEKRKSFRVVLIEEDEE